METEMTRIEMTVSNLTGQIRSVFQTLLYLGIAVLFSLCSPHETMADERPVFYRAINLNGPALMIDGHPWESGNSRGVTCDGAMFENQDVRLIPSTDTNRARMIRSSRYPQNGKARIQFSDVQSGTYSVFLYLWEDNNSETFDIFLNNQRVARNYQSGKAGEWERLGPWVLDISTGSIELSTQGGCANLSGIEIWRGKLTSQEHPIPGPNPVSPPAITRESKVAILLARNCLECHNTSDRKGGLDLSRRQHALAGGDSGVVLKAGSPDESLLLTHIKDGAMPPKGRQKISLEDINLVESWIREGAQWANDPIDPFLYTSDRRAGYNWWSLQPIVAVEPPDVMSHGWNRNPIDQFVWKRLKQSDLIPSPEADRRTLIRRLSFDLLGLPPSPEDVEQFLNDTDPRAYENLVDRMLESPHYGERWARHWLDIVRFGESQGFERNKLRPNAWKYRDFVVEAFNSDLPYDEFVRWQLAGDVLHPGDPMATIASGFLALGPYDLTAYNNGTPDMRAFAREEELEGLVGTVGQTFLGLTLNCSRCHDHKFDPITQKEYYQISAALGGTYQGDEREGLGDPARKKVEEKLATLKTEIQRLDMLLQGTDKRANHQIVLNKSRLESIERLFKGGPVHTTVPQHPKTWHVLDRGDFRSPGEVVGPRGIAAISRVSADWNLSEDPPEGERRKALAEWITNPSNPLTPRVIVNRLWGYHFGEGLVRTPSDFGFLGGVPSHPELLDWLANQLIHPTEGKPWSLKRIQRLIVNSATYRQASRLNAKAKAVDADNLLIWHHPTQRLDAESYRDAVLAVSGELNPQMGGPGYRDFKVSSAGNNETYTVFDAVGAEFNRRSLYRTCVRSGTSPLLDSLDCPDPSVATPRRSVTSTPLQALTLLNDVFAEHYAEKFADRLRQESTDDLPQQIRRAYAFALSRLPEDKELTQALRFTADHGLAQFCLVLMNTNEFVFID